MTAQELAAILLEETTFYDRPPPRYAASDNEDETREFASRSAFTALDHAQTVDKRFHPRTWKAVRGTVYEPTYRREFKVPDSESTRDAH